MQSVEYRLKHGHNESFAAQQQRDAIYQREQESAEHQPQEGVPCLGTAYRDRAPRKAACRNRTEQNTHRIDRRANANQNPRHTYERIASINASHNEMLMAEPTTPSCGISSTFASTAKASPIAFTMAHVRSIPLEIMTFASTIFMAEHITAIPTNRSGTADSAKSAPPSNATIGSASNISRAMIAEPNTITKFMFSRSVRLPAALCAAPDNTKGVAASRCRRN